MNKIILALLLALTFSFCHAQSVTIEPSKSVFQQDSTNGVHINSKETIPLKLSTEKPNMYLPFYTYNTLINKKEGEIMAGFGGMSIQGTELLQFGTRGYTSVTIDTIGKLKVGSPTRSSGLEVHSFTKLGSEAPAIKIKRFSTLTSSSAGDCSTFVTLDGIPNSKILSYQVLIDWQSTDWIKEGYTFDPGQEFYTYHKDGQIKICLVAGNSQNITSKAVRVLVTYEE